MPFSPRLGAIAFAVVVSLGLAAPGAARAAGYVAHPLMTGGGQYMAPAGLNDTTAVGRTSDAAPSAVLITRGQAPVTWTVDGHLYNEASAISSNGLVVGNSGDDRFDLSDPFLRQADGSLVSIFAGTSFQGFATGVNASGIVVGMAGTGSVQQHAITWHEGFTVFIPTLGGTNSVANAINDAGVVVGWSDTPAGIGESHAFRWAGGTLTDLGTLPGGTYDSSDAMAINASGYAVGYCQGFALLHACGWDASGIHDLGSLPGTDSSIARAVNAAGVAVGESADPASLAQTRAVVFHDGVIEDLNTLVTLPPDVVLTRAVAIDDRGVILVEARKGRFNTRAYWLAPR